MKQFFLILPLFVWILLFFVDASAYFLLKNRPMYFRAWEYVLNDGTDSYYVPFKPLHAYIGRMEGDLLRNVGFVAHDKDVRHQEFIVDEYGFRNRVGMLDHDVDAVVVGTSFVGGAQETQDNLISEILTRDYAISTYNYATLPLQHFWEDERFVLHPPKYLFIVMNESEALQNTWVEVLTPSETRHSVPAWKTADEWLKHKSSPSLSYTSVVRDFSRYSLVRYMLDSGYLRTMNAVFPRNALALSGTSSVVYEPDKDMLYFDVGRYDPLYSSISEVAIQQTIATLGRTRDVLMSRGIRLVVAVVPAKNSLYYRDYRNVPTTEKSLYHFEQHMAENNIDHIPLLEVMTNEAKTGDSLYFSDDGHWTSRVNYIISLELNRVIRQ